MSEHKEGAQSIMAALWNYYTFPIDLSEKELLEKAKSLGVANTAAGLIEKFIHARKTQAEMLEALKAQHNAIDTLFALLIIADKNFRPTKNEKLWNACMQGNAAIARAEDKCN